MIDQLIQVISNILSSAKPLVVIREYQRGVLFRLGKFRMVLRPGLHPVIPFADHIDAYPVVWTTLTLPAQSIVTQDGHEVVVKAMVKFRINDVKKYGVDVYDAKDAIQDISCAAVFEVVSGRNWDNLHEEAVGPIACAMAAAASKEWGVEIRDLTITDLSRMRSIRLINEGRNVG